MNKGDLILHTVFITARYLLLLIILMKANKLKFEFEIPLWLYGFLVVCTKLNEDIVNRNLLVYI